MSAYKPTYSRDVIYIQVRFEQIKYSFDYANKIVFNIG